MEHCILNADYIPEVLFTVMQTLLSMWFECEETLSALGSLLETQVAH